MKSIKVTPIIGIQDIKTNRFINHPVGCRLADVGSNIRSNNFNFEEEQLLGNDRIITRQYENDCYRETIEFRTKQITNQFYYIEYYEYDLRPDSKDFDITLRGHALDIDLYNKNNETFVHPAEGQEPALVQKYKLYQKDANGKDELISIREVRKDVITENDIRKPKIIEKIIHPLPPNVYYDNGQLNKELAYDNTDFATKTVYRGDFIAFNNYGDTAVYDLIKDKIGDGKIYEFLGTNAAEFLPSDNSINADLTDPNLDTNTRFSTDFGVLFLPLRLPAGTYTKLYATFKMTDKIDNRWSAHLYTNVASTSLNKFINGVYIYGSASAVVPDDEFTLEATQGSQSDASPYIGIATGSFKHVEIKKIWFE